MPIFRINDQFHHFSHVPKCGGTSVEIYLGQRRTRTLPQHVTAAGLELIIPRDWITASFATVHHLVRRAISTFYFWRDHLRPGIPLNAEVNTWCAEAIPANTGGLAGTRAAEAQALPAALAKPAQSRQPVTTRAPSFTVRPPHPSSNRFEVTP